MDIDEIKELIEMMNQTDIAELKVESDGVKISIKKGSALAPIPPPAPPAPQPPAETRARGSDGEERRPADEEIDSDRFVTVSAPMVGTFYRAPAPDADPYVKVGDMIEPGQPLCIIEAMKLMNEIESEVQGRVARILVENAEPVEYGQPLFLIELVDG